MDGSFFPAGNAQNRTMILHRHSDAGKFTLHFIMRRHMEDVEPLSFIQLSSQNHLYGFTQRVPEFPGHEFQIQQKFLDGLCCGKVRTDGPYDGLPVADRLSRNEIFNLPLHKGQSKTKSRMKGRSEKCRLRKDSFETCLRGSGNF